MLNCQKMLSSPHTAICFYRLRSLAKTYRSVCSDRSQLFQGNSYSDPNARVEQPKNLGYGEKEISLLHPVDARTPLPGNTGVAPLTIAFQVKSTSPTKISSDKYLQTFLEMPEDRHRNALTHLACAIVENILHPPFPLECIAYECPELLRKDFLDLFPKLNFSRDNLTVITLCQKTEEDMSQWSEKSESERNHAGEIFIMAAQLICSALRDSGYFADFIHPSTGKPFLGKSLTSSTMFETDVRYSHFGFTIEDLGCCKVISHHLWGTNIYVGAVFTNASINSPEVKVITSND